ncbi:hypothetical protein MNBD_GAMMA08-311 [hydrothermal vent metagenome]|uniref:OmpA-like domain-containing protein n=1 Tax=hydrothermal vent metagenome TaxID=652676 RepID=A0A3B0X8S0_9ZZZZ
MFFKKRLIAISIACAVLGACTTTSSIIESNKITVATGFTNDVKDCEFTQRDLSMPWKDREYWCAREERKKTLQHRNEIYAKERKNIEQTRAALKKTKKNLMMVIDEMGSSFDPSKRKINVAYNMKNIDKNDLINKVQLGSLFIPKQTHNKSIDIVEEKSTFLSIEDNKKTNPILKYVWFAEKTQVLGPKGHEYVKSLLSSLKNADHILLRGYMNNDEFQDDDQLILERISVARSLSVRKVLHVEGGIDKSKIKILHHKQGTSGRYVEVIVNG